MNQQSRDILQRSLMLISNYRRDEIIPGQLVSGLEGSINTLEKKMSEEFYSAWYNHWGNLEIVLALGTEAQYRKEIFEDLKELEKIISNQLTE